MRRDGFTYFEIVDSKDKIMVFCPSGLSQEEAADYLKDSLDAIQEGEFSVILYLSEKKKSVNKTFSFKINTTSIAGFGGGLTQAQIDREKALDRRELEWNFKRMLEDQDKKHQAEIEELKVKESGGIMGVIDGIQNIIDKYPVIGTILSNYASKLMGEQQTTAINGVDDMETDLQRIAQMIGGEQALKDLVKVVADRVSGKRGFEFMVKLQAFFKEFDGSK